MKLPSESLLPVPARLAAVAVAFGSLACGRERPLTYHEDVASIVAERCMGCHRKDGVAPVPSLENYEQVARAARKIRVAVQTREMPPWGADNSGFCRTWRGAHWLDDAEIRTLTDWAAEPRQGDPARARPAAAASPTSFRPSGAALDTGGDWTPGLGPSAYRCFVVDPGVARDRLVTAFRVTSTEPRSVAQITVYALDTPAADAAAVALDEADPGLGYTCFGSPRVPDTRLVTSWTWDSSVLRLPSGTGVRLRGGRRVVVQIHYNAIATGLDVPTRTRIELELGEGESEASFLAISAEPFQLPPARRHARAKGEVSMARAWTLLGVAPRLHTLGRAMQLDLFRSAEGQCVANFDHWNFYRQRFFEYTTPLSLERGDSVRISCTYDTQSRSEPTEMGDRIDQEECLASLLVTER